MKFRLTHHRDTEDTEPEENQEFRMRFIECFFSFLSVPSVSLWFFIPDAT